MRKIEIGSVYRTQSGFEVVVTDRLPSRMFEVEFQTPVVHRVIVSGGNLSCGSIKNLFDPIVAGIGFRGLSDVSAKTKCYSSWNSILKRVSKNARAKDKIHYGDCSICSEWLNLEAYSEWFNNQVVQDAWHIDKDLLVHGNKIYSPSTCIFLPLEINAFLTDRANHRGDYPLGVRRSKNKIRFEVQCTSGGKNNYLGSYSTVEEAFDVYKKFKISRAILLADKWNGIIDPRAVDALRNFTVDIND